MDRDPIITADDVVRGGACFDGVMRVVSRFPKRITAAMPVSAVLRLIPKSERHYVLKAADLDGNGNGYGNGYGNGDGDGNGYGNGYGYGDGDGYGYGYGYGNGYGDGGFSEDD